MRARTTSARLRFASYNVRHCLGIDRRVAPARIVDVLGAIDADVIALQELDVGQPRSGRVDQPSWIARELGMSAFFCRTLTCGDGAYGHALLSRLPIVSADAIALPGSPAAEPRKLIDATLGVGPRELRVLATHLGLAAPDRAAQALTLAERISDHDGPIAVLADLNAGPGQVGYEELIDPLRDPLRPIPLRARSTWPSPWPFRALDHVLLSPSIETREVWVNDRGPARFASDHRPVVADVQVVISRQGMPIGAGSARGADASEERKEEDRACDPC